MAVDRRNSRSREFTRLGFERVQLSHSCLCGRCHYGHVSDFGEAVCQAQEVALVTPKLLDLFEAYSVDVFLGERVDPA